MKSRFLHFRFSLIILGFIAFFACSISYAGTPDAGNTAAGRMQKIRANQNTGVIAPGDIMKAQEQVNKLAEEKAMSDVNLNWQQLGPNNAAGRTRTILFSNKDASGSTILTGGVAGGIWKSRNLGLTWHQMNVQNNEVLRVTSMVQTASGTIYVATGESSCNKNQYIGSGLYRSDNDSIFTAIPNTQPIVGNQTSDWAYIAKLAVSSTGRIYAATNTGLKYSDDGATWLVAKAGYAYTVAVGPDGTVLADIDHLAYIALGGDLSLLTNISTNTATTLPNTGVSGIEFAIAPSDANTMYASFVNLTGALLNLYKSSDKGTTWSIVFPGNSTYSPLGDGCYANSLAVFPTDPNQVYLGGLEIWHGQKYTETGYYNWEMVSQPADDERVYELGSFFLPLYQHQIVFRPNFPGQFGVATDDGISVGTITSNGASYQHLVKNLIISQFNSVAYSIRNDAGFGGASFVGAELIPGDSKLNEPENGVQLYAGYGADVQWSMISPTCVFYASGSASGAPYIRTEDLGVTPSPTFMGALTNGSYAVAHFWEDFNFTQSVDTVVFVEKVAPVQKDSVFIVPSANEKFPMRIVATHDIALRDTVKVQDVIQSRFFISGFIAGKSGIYMTKQALQFSVDPTWFRIANTLPGDVITAYAVSKDLGVLWAGTSRGKLFRLTNITHANDATTACADSAGCVIGHTLYDTTVYAQFTGRYITSISMGPDNATVLITLGNYGNTNYVYKTTNGLDATPTFTSVQGSLPAMPVYSGVFEMSNPSNVMVGTEYGVFSTNDITAGSPVWTAQNVGCGNVPVTMIKQQTNQGLYYYRPMNYGELFMASYGRGLFYDESFSQILSTPTIQSTLQNKLKVQPNPFTTNVSISYTLTKNATVQVTVYDLSGRIMFTTSLGTQQPGDYTRALDLQSLPSGTYIIKLDNGAGPLFGKALKIK